MVDRRAFLKQAGALTALAPFLGRPGYPFQSGTAGKEAASAAKVPSCGRRTAGW